MENSFVQYISEDNFFTELFKHARNMGIASGYKMNYELNGQRVSGEPLVVRHRFCDSESHDIMFDMYEGERIGLEAGMGKAMRTVQFIVPPKVMERCPKVKEDLELLCSRVFKQDPRWVSVENLPMPVEKEKSGCSGIVGYMLGKIANQF